MNDMRLLIGSLSNDLFRIATLQQRGSEKAAQRFLQEAKKWAQPLSIQAKKKYIRTIATEIVHAEPGRLSLEKAELYLMYGILLQNYALHYEL